ncbi:hypothetical protein A1O3_04863 [Capronia epimyces CBS 606.96]|uniref:C6 finger domain-containing protein n=1 Tax=Capronia epimyces CBS 606.96 TaxID=1182542 RepID=W9Y4P5_9EURO|nr:uncharacterized protein A1O3_04863 [Capronia epimyces CBS 606.96]EXJ84196.1 hypothetical protein A1O3_04863 [Capronia epimyces CBS 606.96]
MSQRDCSFALHPSTGHPSTTRQALLHDRSVPQSPADDNGSHSGSSNSTLPNARSTPLTTASLSDTGTPSAQADIVNNRSHLERDATLGDDGVVNINHMELLIHISADRDLFNLGHVDLQGDTDADSYPSYVAHALKLGLESPYLLHQMLAFSARHLAFLHPERASTYHHLAVTLQTRAVSLFNQTSWTETGEVKVDRSNCVAVLLFSVVLGHHLFADTFARRDDTGSRALDTFLTHCLQCIKVHRGIHTVAVSAWPLLMESELEPILSWSSGFNQRTPQGHHCKAVTELLDTAYGMTHEEKEACQQAHTYLQIGFDAVLADADNSPTPLSQQDQQGHAQHQKGNRYQMIISWIMLASPEFTRLLAAKRPEALVLLAYYALLLHHGRTMWQVGDAGAYMLRIIADFLGPEWERWLSYPREMVFGGGE